MTEKKDYCYYCGAEIKSTETKCLKCGKNLLTFEEAKMLKEAATQTRFTWVVLLLTFITALIGLLALTKTFEGNWWTALFIAFLILAYFCLTVGLGYSFYALCRTTFIIDLLGKFKQSDAVNNFLDAYWKVEYTKFIIKKDGEIKTFRERIVKVLAVVICILSIILLITRLITSFRF